MNRSERRQLPGSATAAITLALIASTIGCGRSGPAALDLHLSSGTRLLVIAPHPDDETLAAAGLIRRVRTLRGRVRVVLATSGDGFAEGVEEHDRIRQPTPNEFRSYGRTRERETIAAMGRLGVPRTDLTFLGFPDQGLCLIASRYLSTRVRPFESPFTDRETPPGGEQLIRGVGYRGADFERELQRVIADYDPTVIVAPHPEDDHPDHCATALFAGRVLQTLSFGHRHAPKVLRYLIHYGQWPVEIPYNLRPQLTPPIGFPSGEGPWSSLALTADEAALKEAAIAEYTSQVQVIGRFLKAFARTNELYLEREPRSPECWCDAENVATALPKAQRRGPFRHAR